MTPLRIPTRRAQIAGFWTALFLFVFLFSGALAAAAKLPWWWAWGAAIGCCAVLPGLFWRRWLRLGVTAWNRGARLVMALLRQVAMRLCFFLIFTVAGRGSRFPFAGIRAGDSMWQVRSSGSGSGEIVDATDLSRAGWLGGLRAHARQTGNGWMLCLVPFLVTLMVLGDEQEDTAPPTSTYTLY